MIIQEIVQRQRAFFHTGATRPLDFRLEALRTLRKQVRLLESDISAALHADLGKTAYESYMTEIGIVLSELTLFEKRLSRFMRPKRVPSSLLMFPSKSRIMYEPYGVTLIISPWNYPFQLSIMPLIGALAAGNTVILKPASYAPNTARIIQKLIEAAFPSEHVCVVLGGREENQLLLDQKVDYIFFTGSVHVGKTVMEKASRHLTPVTLELGGKSPTIIDVSANIKRAAKCVAFGKFLNAGQTCIAPDYVWIPKEKKSTFITWLNHYITAFFGPNPLQSDELPKIINPHHHQRLQKLMAGEHVVIGGEADSTKITPTVLDDVRVGSPIMQEEIFGPILPLLTYSHREEVIAYLQNQPKPLALYLFAEDKNIQKYWLAHLSFGGATINDTIMHYLSPYMGFGGVGESGMGRYHGRLSFLTFSNARSVVFKGKIIDLHQRYHPYTQKKWDFLKRFLK